MKVICINTDKHNRYTGINLTPGKVYDVVEVVDIPFNPNRYADYSGFWYRIVNDIGELSGYAECVRLLTKAEEREERFKEIGI
jgi:hypothetical protein